MTSMDIGCGFTEGVQVPVYADISLDLNMNQVQPTFLKKLKEHNSNPLCASATHLPIRSEIMTQIYWNAVLEHLPRQTTIDSIRDGKRVLKKGGEAKVILPIITAHMHHYLIVLWTQFPFSMYDILFALYRANKYWHIPGVPHLTDVKPYHLKRVFREVIVEKHLYRHKWFHYPWGRITRRFVNNRFIPDIQGQYHIRCIK